MHRERDAVAGRAERLDLLGRARLLATELVARHADHAEATVGVLLVQRLEAGVLRREAALAGDVDDEQRLAGVVGERRRLALERLERDLVQGHGRSILSNDAAMTRRLDSKVALVTGAASGIGLGIARRFLQEGASVLLADLDGEGLAEATAALGEGAAGTVADITDEEDVVAMVAAAVERFGRLDVAVNAAYGVKPLPGDGLAPVGVPIADQSSEFFAAVIDVGLVGPYRCIKHEARQMVVQGGGGVIINLASINARQPAITMSAYCAAKAGVEMVTRCAALELGAHGIRVVALAPGLVDTPMTGFITSNEDFLARYLRDVPLGRAGNTDDIGSAALFLASDEASFVSGETLVVDGAQMTKGFSL